MNEQLRTERLSLLIGMTLGQMAELLNNLASMTNQQIYKSLFDIHQAAGLHVHELFYKENMKEPVPDKQLDLDIEIGNLDWHDRNAPRSRIIACLRAENIITVRQLLEKSKYFLRKIPNFGRKSERYLLQELKNIGLSLKEGNWND